MMLFPYLRLVGAQAIFATLTGGPRHAGTATCRC